MTVDLERAKARSVSILETEAASSVWKPSTSRGTSAARCFAGSCYSATDATRSTGSNRPATHNASATPPTNDASTSSSTTRHDSAATPSTPNMPHTPHTPRFLPPLHRATNRTSARIRATRPRIQRTQSTRARNRTPTPTKNLLTPDLDATHRARCRSDGTTTTTTSSPPAFTGPRTPPPRTRSRRRPSRPTTSGAGYGVAVAKSEGSTVEVHVDRSFTAFGAGRAGRRRRTSLGGTPTRRARGGGRFRKGRAGASGRCSRCASRRRRL
jgi:hypothetical protein